MNTLKLPDEKKQLKLILTPRTHHSKNLEQSIKLATCTSVKHLKQDAVILSRKLLQEVKTLQNENKILRNKITDLEEDKRILILRCKHYEYCQQITNESSILFEAANEIKSQAQLSQSIIYQHQNQRWSLPSLIQSKYDQNQATERINNIRLKTETNIKPKSQNILSIKQQMKQIILNYSNKIKQLLKTNQNLAEISKIYRQKYIKLKEQVKQRNSKIQKNY